MKKLLFLVAMLAAATAHALPQNLPHHNRSDVNATVKTFIPWNQFDIITTAAPGAGDPALAEINSLGLVGIQMASTGDDAHVLIPLPDNICVDCQIKFSVLWSTDSTTTTEGVTWKVLYNEGALGSALAAAATALDTVITSDSPLGTAYMLNETPQGVIAAGTVDRNDILHVLAETDAFSGGMDPASDIVFLHGIFMEYTREKL
jgi:hypothetical protein